MMRIFIIVAECSMLFVLSFGVLVASSLIFVDRVADADPPWKLTLVLLFAVLGLLALWAGFVFSVLLRKRLKNGTLNALLVGLLLGCVADVYFFISGASIGAGYVGVGFFGWLMLAALYGGPILMAAHVVMSAFNGRKAEA